MASNVRYDIVEDDGFVLLNRTSAPEVFAEGFTQVMIGVPMSKVVLHSVVDPKEGDGKELRRTVQTLTVPTISLLELATLVTTLCKQSEEQLSQAGGNDFATKLKALLSAGANPLK